MSAMAKQTGLEALKSPRKSLAYQEHTNKHGDGETHICIRLQSKVVNW